MKNSHGKIKLSALSLAVAGALAQMYGSPTFAEDAEVAALTRPTNTIEVGVVGISNDSAKFGEYSGLNKSGAEFVGNFSIRGGDGYGGEEAQGTTRWGVEGSDLGLTSRSFGANVSNQGKWRIGVGYDELRHNLTDSYQTPYVGNVGDNRFTLPSTFTATADTTTLTAAKFHPLDIYSARKNTSLWAGWDVTSQWNVSLDYNHLEQSGAKLMAFGSMSNGTSSGEYVSILPNPTNYTTDTVNMAVNWAGEKAHATVSYFGSYFRNSDDRVVFETFAGGKNLQTMSVMPDNNFHQLNLSGGYAFSPKTKLAANLSYGRNTQNENYAYDSFMMGAASPTSSLNGVVVSTHADLKLSDRSIKDLTLAAGVKYDKRDNQTTSNIYNFLAIDGGNAAIYPNTPLSYDKTQVELSGDYRLTKTQNIRVVYNHDEVSRWCDSYATGLAVAAGTKGYYPAGTNCVVATDTKEDKIGATYRIKALDTLSLNAGYAIADRKTNSDQKAITAFISQRGGTTRGINGGDFLGFYPYYNASRVEQSIKAGANWEATEKLSVSLSGRYTDDQYDDSTYGVQNGNTWSLNLDATYAYSEKGSLSAFVTQQHRQRDLKDQQSTTTASATRVNVPLGATWTNKLNDDDTTVGLALKQNGLFGGKFDLAGDLTYSFGKSRYHTDLNYNGLTTGSFTCAAAFILSCGDLPDIKNEMTQFKLVGTYNLDKHSKIALGYLYQHLTSSDYYYNGLQLGYTPTQVMPTNQNSGSYDMSLLSATYIYAF